ncbi:H-NS histone family protein [Maritalea sp.]|uniref:H-NS histone family protein n=1 Tax=Maritalea sp. TaxID=2003361 RepID=UPI003EF2C63C
MTTNYSSMNLDRLKKEKIKIEKAIANREAKAKGEVLAKLVAMAQDSGIDLSELAGKQSRKTRTSAKAVPEKKPTRGKKKTSSRRGKVAPKYRNPNDPSMTWSGRGIKPIWVRDHLDNGGSIESITI